MFASAELHRVENGEDIVAEVVVPVLSWEMLLQCREVTHVSVCIMYVSCIMIQKVNDDEMSVLKLGNTIEEYKTGKYTSIIQCAQDHNVNRSLYIACTLTLNMFIVARAKRVQYT